MMTALFLQVALLLLLSFNGTVVTAFTTTGVQQPQRLNSGQLSNSKSSPSTSTDTPIAISGINVHITPALDEYVHKRIGKVLSKFSGSIITECDVVLSVSKNPKVRRIPTPCHRRRQASLLGRSDFAIVI
jgi:hypothetical protein